jgi:Fe2+ or Zn2+ uptake regulation protein
MSEWETRLAASGYRLTAARRAILQVLSESPVPLSPLEICRQGQARCTSLGPATVYRTLELLEKESLVRRVYQENGACAYLPALPGHRHAILCRSCGRAAEFPGSEDWESLAALVQQATGYRVEGHLLQLMGLCPDCQREEAK